MGTITKLTPLFTKCNIQYGNFGLKKKFEGGHVSTLVMCWVRQWKESSLEFGNAFCFSIICQSYVQQSLFNFYISTLKTVLEHYLDYTLQA